MMNAVLAAALLSTAQGVPEQVPTEVEWSIIQPSVRQLAEQWEILDPRESNYILAKRHEWPQDIDLLRRRWADYKDAPRLADCERFPGREAVNEAVVFNRAYRRHLEQRAELELDRARELTAAIEETDAIYRLLDHARDSRQGYYYITVRRAGLRYLRDHLSAEDYAAGRIPAAAPTWRFSELR